MRGLLTESIAAALVVGVALTAGAGGARAQSAEDDFQRAMDQCAGVRRGQRSFCMIQAQHQFRAARAREQRQDVVIHHDYDASNDTPVQTAAKAAYEAAAEKCADLPKEQRSSCMIDAHDTYEKGMGW